MTVSRRTFLAAAGLSCYAQSPLLKIVVTGGHPGDPECGCAGTIARYTDLGHQVSLLYLNFNRGEGFRGAERNLLAPSAARTANSLARAADRARSRLATLAHAITSTKPAAPNSIHSVGRTSRTQLIFEQRQRFRGRLLRVEHDGTRERVFVMD